MTDPRQEIDGVHITKAGEGTAQVVIQPGTEVPPLGDTKTARVLVKDGAVRVSISEGAGEVLKGSGAAIRSGNDDIVFCDRGTCEFAIGDSAVLTAGNSCFVRDGVLHLEVVGDQAAELHMSAQGKGGEGPQDEPLPSGATTFAAGGGGGGGSATPLRCWLCPFM